jgi:hypothetical protein
MTMKTYVKINTATGFISVISQERDENGAIIPENSRAFLAHLSQVRIAVENFDNNDESFPNTSIGISYGSIAVEVNEAAVEEESISFIVNETALTGLMSIFHALMNV